LPDGLVIISSGILAVAEWRRQEFVILLGHKWGTITFKGARIAWWSGFQYWGACIGSVPIRRNPFRRNPIRRNANPDPNPKP